MSKFPLSIANIKYILTVILSAYINIQIYYTSQKNGLSYFRDESAFLLFGQIAFLYLIIPLVCFIGISVAIRLTIEIYNSGHGIMIFSVLAAFLIGMILQYELNRRDIDRWETVFKNRLKIVEQNWVDGVKKTCTRADINSFYKCTRTLISDKEMIEYWDAKNADAEAAAETSPDRYEYCPRC